MEQQGLLEALGTLELLARRVHPEALGHQDLWVLPVRLVRWEAQDLLGAQVWLVQLVQLV